MIICKFCGGQRQTETEQGNAGGAGAIAGIKTPCHSNAEYYEARRKTWEDFYKSAMASGVATSATYLERVEHAIARWEEEFPN